MAFNPFLSDIFPDGFPVASEDSPLHASALEDLECNLQALLESPISGVTGGRVIQLKAPRAGFGKSHLLEHLRYRLTGKALVYQATYDPDKEFLWSSLFWGMLQSFHQEKGAGVGVTLLDEIGRRTFARLNKELIREGRVPCANPDAAISAIEARAVELFDLSDPRQAVGRWFAEHFERLLPGTSGQLASDVGISESAAATWLRMLCGYTQGLPDGPAVRFENLRWAANQGDSTSITASGMQMIQMAPTGEGYYKDRLAEFCRIAGTWRPLVLIFDDLDTLHGNAESTMRVASVIAELRRLLPQTMLILSINQDLWANTFQKFLPSALEDRLSAAQVNLGGLGRAEAEALLHHRLHHAGTSEQEALAYLRYLNLPEIFGKEPARAASARTLLRHAARVWETFKESMARQTIQSELGHSSPEQPAVHPAPVLFPGATMQQLKELLGKFTKKETDDTPVSSPVILPDPATPPEGPVPNPPSALVTIAAPEENQAWKKCQQIRLKLLEAKNLRIDQDMLCHLLEAGGRHLAVVKASHVAVPGSSGPGALVWHSPDGEIYFGTESHDDRSYWQALLAHVKAKSIAHSGEVGKRVWLVVFSLSAAPLHLDQWMENQEIALARGRYLDVYEMTPDELATIYAVDEVLHESEQAQSPLPPPAATFTSLASLLEPFWKRVTRPIRQTEDRPGIGV